MDTKQWLKGYLYEIQRVSNTVGPRLVNSIFFGGGTPSLMDPEIVEAVIGTIKSSFPISNQLEVTLEANPTSVEAGRFAAYQNAGVNRISMGIQALNDPDLRRLGRLHTAQEARLAFETARNIFARVSFDLIYARQYQTLAQWQAELSEALAMAVDHFSLYQLTVEAGTAFGDRYKIGKLPGLPNNDLGANLYELTQSLCDAHNMPAYEVSNHAKKGAECLHNLIYWRYGDYAGIGPGAHGRLTLKGQKFATEAFYNPDKWLAAVEQGTGEKSAQQIDRTAQATEYLLMGLRIKDGIDLERFENLAGAPLNIEAQTSLEDMGLLIRSDKSLKATRAGTAVLNSVISSLLEA
jgi:putative oxygen-independent coproporphyrinogen III oxidase